VNVERLTRDAVLRIGEVSGVEGRRISVLVDSNKNLSDMFLDGEIIKNIAVNGYVEIRKGFLSIIGRVEGERIEDDPLATRSDVRQPMDRSRRVLTIALSGYVSEDGRFYGGTRELPLIGNEAYLISREKLHLVHNLVQPGALSINIAKLYGDEFDISLPVDGLFNGHIAIFGNTGSGKTNTLAALYQEMLRSLAARNAEAFKSNTRYLLFDFNGEYTAPNCITGDKSVFSLSTRISGDKLPLDEGALLDIEVLSILAEATDKTQKPFLRRSIRLLRVVYATEEGTPEGFFKGILRKRITDLLQMSDKVRAFLIFDYLQEIFFGVEESTGAVDLSSDLEWQNNSQEFKTKTGQHYLAQQPAWIPTTLVYQKVETFVMPSNLLGRVLVFMYIQLITDILSNRAQNDHIAPVINRLKSKRHEIEKVLDFTADATFWKHNFAVVNLNDVSLEMKKTIPLLLCKKFYAEHKMSGAGKTLTIVVDEAHNILSSESSREAETWKEYRLETFEEIIKEGRKFGVFITISSQRPSDISPTITSQAHNYFIHRLINEWDLRAISSSVSYIDRVTEESIPTLPTGTCIFSGVASPIPLKVNITPLPDHRQPRSATRKFTEVVPALPGHAHLAG
jgi:DNA helicase HerA-like ATPase